MSSSHRGSGLELPSISVSQAQPSSGDDETTLRHNHSRRSSQVTSAVMQAAATHTHTHTHTHTAVNIKSPTGNGDLDEDDHASQSASAMKHLTPRNSFHDELPSTTLRRSLPERILTHFVTNVLSILLIILDAALYTYRTIANKEGIYIQIAFVLLAIFCTEVALRILVLRSRFFKDLWQVGDALFVAVSMVFTLDAFPVSVEINSILALCLQSARVVFRIICRWRELAPSARLMVSTNKARYNLHGFDLDLVYITDRIIAMGLPSIKLEGLYRNPIDEVARFFNLIHKDHYLIINLCAERTYPTGCFNNHVVRFPFDDHNPPPLSVMLAFCVYVEDFLQQSPLNVVAIHCKGGKGRTGTMICAWLLYSQKEMYTEQALKYFAERRTATDTKGKLQGVAGPSQKRYIKYFEELRFVGTHRGSILRNSFDLFHTGPKAELISITLNHVTPKKNQNALQNDQDRDAHNRSWNSSKNWSLLITHYPPRDYNHAVGMDDVDAQNLARYRDTQEFYFKAKRDEDDDGSDSITIDIASWQNASSSLVLAGDLKFQIFRGDLDTHVRKTSSSLLRSPGSDEKPFVFCWFWLHTSFLPTTANQHILRKEAIDEVFKDDTVDDEFNIYLRYNSPPKHENTIQPMHMTPLIREAVDEMDDESEDEHVVGDERKHLDGTTTRMKASTPSHKPISVKEIALDIHEPPTSTSTSHKQPQRSASKLGRQPSKRGLSPSPALSAASPLSSHEFSSSSDEDDVPRSPSPQLSVASATSPSRPSKKGSRKKNSHKKKSPRKKRLPPTSETSPS